ncbi:hypothetical protein IAD21_02692 [Abditibacteriota bacterium]|nr:hypothetical protein IAD21_02692 [Abditibacteriota bacterium]
MINNRARNRVALIISLLPCFIAGSIHATPKPNVQVPIKTVPAAPATLPATKNGNAMLGQTVVQQDSKKSPWESYAAPLAALVICAISNMVLWRKISADSKAAIRKDLSLQQVGYLRDKLTKFYDPMVALLKLNEDVFASVGPPSYPEDDEKKIEAVEVWEEAILRVVLPTNRKISDLILSYSHFSENAQESELYSRFMSHAISYEIFRSKGNAIHRKFPYPFEILNAVMVSRQKTIVDLSELESKVISGKEISPILSDRNKNEFQLNSRGIKT